MADSALYALLMGINCYYPINNGSSYWPTILPGVDYRPNLKIHVTTA